MVRTIKAVSNFSIRKKRQGGRERERKLEKGCQKAEKFYPYEQTQLKKSYVRPASPLKPHPFINQANISPSYFPKPGKALMQLLPSHTPLLSNPDGTQHRTTCCVTQLKEEKIDSHSNAGDAVQMEQNTFPRHTHTHTRTQGSCTR